MAPDTHLFQYHILAVALLSAHLLAGFIIAVSRRLFGPLCVSLTHLALLFIFTANRPEGPSDVLAPAALMSAVLLACARYRDHFVIIPFKSLVFLSLALLLAAVAWVHPFLPQALILANALYAFLIIKSLVDLSSKDQQALILLAETQALLADRKKVLEATNRQIASGNLELERANKKMALILDTANDAFISMDSQGVILEWNRRAHSLFGLTREETVGQKVNVILIPEAYQKEIDSEMVKFIGSPEKYVIDKLIEVRAFKKNGAEFPAEMSLSIFQYEGNYTFNAFIRDISDRKRLERMKDDFLSTVSHELRTPLAIVKGAVSNLKDGILGAMTDKQQKVIETVDRNIARLARLINDLLDLSRLESGKIQARMSAVDLKGLIHEILGGFRSLSEERGVKVEPDIRPDLPVLMADMDMLTQVMTNLVSNALRYAKQSVILKIYTEPEGRIHIVVKDDGIGISEEHLPALFNKFLQINRPQGGSGYKGTGLGLAICKEIVHLHHGEIWAESRYGLGAAFHVLLPLEQP